MSIIETRPIGSLIRNSDTPERTRKVEHFIIPDYQRGYRWEEKHVSALLKDINDFRIESNSNTDKYCLQPIVVTKNDNEGSRTWEVIDGQQRLTTLYLIFKCLGKPHFELFFENREESTHFIQSLNESNYSDEQPDFHFIGTAHQVITKWLKEKDTQDPAFIDKFYITICENVQVIWYELQEVDKSQKIDVFHRLNIGRIPLTDAELIRALLLSGIKQKMNEREGIIRQAEIAGEWDRIEKSLRIPSFWALLNPRNDSYTSHIEFIFDLIATTKQTEYSTYMWFEQNVKSSSNTKQRCLELWNEIRETFSILQSWFHQREVYHYIGYLRQRNVSINDLIIDYKGKTKSEFVQSLVKRVQEDIKDIDLEEEETLNYERERSKPKIHRTLLLHNILTLNSMCDTEQNRFPFDLYSQIKADKGWSIEHIHAQKSEEIKKPKAMRKWLEDTQETLLTIHKLEKENEDIVLPLDKNTEEFENKTSQVLDIEVLKQRITCMLRNTEEIDTNDFKQLKDELIDAFDSTSLHVLDNLTLLSKVDNSALNNNIFPVKRSKIIQLEKNGSFIPPCTRNVFFKFYSNADNQPYYWSASDKKAYSDDIKRTINEFRKK